MSNREQIREVVLKELIEGTIDGSVAAIKLHISVRQVKRLKREYISQGSQGLIHKLRGKMSTHKISPVIEATMVDIIKSNSHDFGPTLVQEKLSLIHSLHYSDETVRRVMIENGIWKSRTKRKMAYHPWRERRASYGELQQFDGCYHNWFEGRNPDIPEVCLLVSIDDATSSLTGAEFAENEGVEAVFGFFWRYIQTVGIPLAAYLDRFSTYKINHPRAVDNHNLMTQFQRAAKTLTLTLITAHTPQAKGRVERVFLTLQDRLVKELRLQNISTIPEANVFLKHIFMPEFNRKFSVIPRSAIDMHRPVPLELLKALPSIFSIQSVRTINTDFTIQFKNTWYQLQEIQPTTIRKGDRVQMEERLDGTVHISSKGHYLNTFVLPEKPKKLKSEPLILTTHKLNWRPPADHPWRHFIIN